MNTTRHSICRMHIAIVAGLTLASTFVAITGFATAETESPASFTVKWTSKMMRVHRDKDAEPRADLATLPKKPGFFAIGPLAGLRGEITAVDGTVYVSRVVNGKPVVSNDANVQAPFMVYGEVREWQAIPLPPEVQTIEDLEAHVPVAAQKAGLNTTTPVPFKVHVKHAKLDYHVISNPDAGFAIKRPHKELMVHFPIEDRPATLIGVYSTEHAGIFTHHGSTTHIHVVSDDGHDAGHLDKASLGEGATLLLPKP